MLLFIRQKIELTVRQLWLLWWYVDPPKGDPYPGPLTVDIDLPANVLTTTGDSRSRNRDRSTCSSSGVRGTWCMIWQGKMYDSGEHNSVWCCND